MNSQAHSHHCRSRGKNRVLAITSTPEALVAHSQRNMVRSGSTTKKYHVTYTLQFARVFVGNVSRLEEISELVSRFQARLWQRRFLVSLT